MPHKPRFTVKGILGVMLAWSLLLALIATGHVIAGFLAGFFAPAVGFGSVGYLLAGSTGRDYGIYAGLVVAPLSGAAGLTLCL